MENTFPFSSVQFMNLWQTPGVKAVMPVSKLPLAKQSVVTVVSVAVFPFCRSNHPLPVPTRRTICSSCFLSKYAYTISSPTHVGAGLLLEVKAWLYMDNQFGSPVFVKRIVPQPASAGSTSTPKEGMLSPMLYIPLPQVVIAGSIETTTNLCICV